MKQSDNILWWNLRLTNIFTRTGIIIAQLTRRASRRPFACIELDARRQGMSAVLV